MTDELLLALSFIALIILLAVVIAIAFRGMKKSHRNGSLIPPTDPITILSIPIALLTMGSYLAFVLFIPTLLSNLRPECQFLRSMQGIPLDLVFLISISCMILSWFLARFDKYAVTFEGFGTKMFGNKITSKGYIATKWIVAMNIPMLPVRSYELAPDEIPDARRRKSDIAPLDAIVWDQVRETVQSRAWVYILLFLVLFTLIYLCIWMCNKEGIPNYA
jgi:hypothetical protein